MILFARIEIKVDAKMLLVILSDFPKNLLAMFQLVSFFMASKPFRYFPQILTFCFRVRGVKWRMPSFRPRNFCSRCLGPPLPSATPGRKRCPNLRWTKRFMSLLTFRLEVMLKTLKTLTFLDRVFFIGALWKKRRSSQGELGEPWKRQNLSLALFRGCFTSKDPNSCETEPRFSWLWCTFSTFFCSKKSQRRSSIFLISSPGIHCSYLGQLSLTRSWIL